MNRRSLITILLAFILGAFFYLRYFGTESIAGVDANGDGIRDDVETLIEEKYSANPRVRSAVRHLAKNLQEAVVHPEATEEKPGTFAVDCLHYITPDQAYEIVETIQAETANTYARTRALIKESARFNGKILRHAVNQAEACAFDPSLTK